MNIRQINASSPSKRSSLPQQPAAAAAEATVTTTPRTTTPTEADHVTVKTRSS